MVLVSALLVSSVSFTLKRIERRGNNVWDVHVLNVEKEVKEVEKEMKTLQDKSY